MKVTKSMPGGKGASKSGQVPRGDFSSSNVQGSRMNEGAADKFRTGRNAHKSAKSGRMKY